MWQTGICEIKREPTPLSVNGIKTTAWKRAVQARADATRLLKISSCEKSVYLIRSRIPRASQHPGSTCPRGLSLHFSRDLHLIPSWRPWVGCTWVILGSWPALFGMSSSSWNLTDFLILKTSRDPDFTTSFKLVPGFFLFLRTPKQEQSFRDSRVYMMVLSLHFSVSG